MKPIGNKPENLQSPGFENLQPAKTKHHIDWQKTLKTVLIQALTSDIIKTIKKMGKKES